MYFPQREKNFFLTEKNNYKIQRKKLKFILLDSFTTM